MLLFQQIYQNGSCFQNLKKDIGKNSNIEEQLEAFNRQIEKLKERSVQVEKIIDEKTNPLRLLERIARSIPEDLWLSFLEITEEKEISLSGYSNSYKSIGEFIQIANETPFFDKTLILSESKPEEITREGKKMRIETFKIKGTIQTYEPFRGNL